MYRLYVWGFLLSMGVNLVAVVLMTLDVSHLGLAMLVPATAVVVMAGLNVQAWFGEPALRVPARWVVARL